MEKMTRLAPAAFVLLTFSTLLMLAATSCLDEESTEQQDSTADSSVRAGTIVVKKSCDSLGEKIFKTQCASCHFEDNRRSTGPGLACWSKRIPGGDWRYEFIRNSSALIASGDVYAVKIFKENNGAVMTNFNLSNEQIDAIFKWVDCRYPCPPGK